MSRISSIAASAVNYYLASEPASHAALTPSPTAVSNSPAPSLEATPEGARGLTRFAESAPAAPSPVDSGSSKAPSTAEWVAVLGLTVLGYAAVGYRMLQATIPEVEQARDSVAIARGAQVATATATAAASETTAATTAGATELSLGQRAAAAAGDVIAGAGEMVAGAARVVGSLFIVDLGFITQGLDRRGDAGPT